MAAEIEPLSVESVASGLVAINLTDMEAKRRLVFSGQKGRAASAPSTPTNSSSFQLENAFIRRATSEHVSSGTHQNDDDCKDDSIASCDPCSIDCTPGEAEATATAASTAEAIPATVGYMGDSFDTVVHSSRFCGVCLNPCQPAPEQPGPCGLCQAKNVAVHRVVFDAGYEQWSKHQVCSHTMCLGCGRGWIRAKLDSRQATIKCPFPDCSCPMFPDDVHRFDVNYYAKVLFLRCQDYGARLKELDEGLKELLSSNSMRACPACCVLVERSEGCSFMVCVCGQTFCYLCGAIDDCSCEEDEYDYD